MTDYRSLVEEKRQAMLNMLLESIENNPGKWEKGWYALDIPSNGLTNKNYTGLNALFLDAMKEKKGYKDNRWVTFNQAKTLGANIRTGEKASEVFFWSKYDKKEKRPFSESILTGMTNEERVEYIQENVRAVLKYYYVFNAAQCERFPEDTRKNVLGSVASEEQNKQLEGLIAKSESKILEDGGDRAYYSPEEDQIHLPGRKSFLSQNNYYATALHEIGHSTGHEKRLNRDLTGGFGSESYAIEELRAELASVFLQSETGINLGDAEIENHGAYLKSWLKKVKEDSSVFFKAAGDAGKIAEYIKQRYLEKELEKEEPISKYTVTIDSTDLEDLFEKDNKDKYKEIPFSDADKIIRLLNEYSTALSRGKKINLTVKKDDKPIMSNKIEIEDSKDGIIEHLKKLADTVISGDFEEGLKAGARKAQNELIPELEDTRKNELGIKENYVIGYCVAKNSKIQIDEATKLLGNKEGCKEIIERLVKDNSSEGATARGELASKLVELAKLRKSQEEIKKYYDNRRIQNFINLENNIPDEMKKLNQWCVFKTYKDNKNKLRKIVLDANQKEETKWAKCDTPETWTSFEKAMEYARENNCEGLTFAMIKENGISCIDLDHQIDKRRGNSKLLTDLLAQASNTFAEKSTSRTGVHIFVKGLTNEQYSTKNDDTRIECYCENKFISMTGDMLTKSKEISEPSKGFWTITNKALGPRKDYERLAELAAEKAARNPKVGYETTYKNMTDDQLIEKMENTKEKNRMELLLGYKYLPGKEKEETVRINFRIKKSEYELFKQLCEISGTNMTEVIIDHIRSLIMNQMCQQIDFCEYILLFFSQDRNNRIMCVDF